MAIRSGRFKSNDATSGLVIILGRTGAFYRILNSGENSFTVHDGNALTQLEPRFSLDVTVTNRIRIETASAVKVEGIYEYLNTDRDTRSGRFKKTMNEADRHKMIDLRGGGINKRNAFYRIFNSGDSPFELRAGESSMTSQEIAPNQSFDFEITSTASHRDIFVNPTNDNTVIEGIYDFLGET